MNTRRIVAILRKLAQEFDQDDSRRPYAGDELEQIRARLDALEAKREVVPLASRLRAAGILDRIGQWRGVKSVYFLQVGVDGPIKIGFTADVESRVATLQTASPFPLRLLGRVPGDEERERAIHLEFAHLRLRGEWFSPAPELLEFITEALGR